MSTSTTYNYLQAPDVKESDAMDLGGNYSSEQSLDNLSRTRRQTLGAREFVFRPRAERRVLPPPPFLLPLL